MLELPTAGRHRARDVMSAQDVNSSDGGWSPAHEAVAGRDYAALAALLRTTGGADAFLAADGESLLHYVADRGDERAARLLLEAGCAKSMKSADDTGMTPMIRAAWAGHASFVAMMLTAGAQPDERGETKVPEGPDGAPLDDSALIVAVCRGHLDVVSALIDAGADVDLMGWMGLSARDHARMLLAKNPMDAQAAAIARVVEGIV